MGKKRPIRRPTEEIALSRIMRQMTKVRESEAIKAKRAHQRKMRVLKYEAEKFFGR